MILADPKPKKRKQTDFKRAKARCLAAMSRYVRLRDCIATTGDSDRGRCVTCNRIYPFKKLQAGHFVAGRRGENLLDERGIHAQCYGCNVCDHGRTLDYLDYMLGAYGPAVVDELRRKANTPTHYTAEDYRDMEREYLRKITILEAGECI